MRYEKKVLKNGLRVVLAPMAEATTVTVFIMTATGSRYETRKENGLSHFLEHMFFKGTTKRPNKEMIAEELDGVGGEYNAYTGKDRTAYYAKVDKKHGAMALDIVSDIFLHSTLPADEIDRERGPILQELNMVEDTPMRHVGDIFEEVLYGDHPLGWEIIGTKENINNFKRTDFIKYWKRAYGSSNVVVGVAGNFQTKEVLKYIEREFGVLENGGMPARKPIKEKQKTPRVLARFKKTDQSHFLLGVRTFDLFHQDRYVLAVLSTLLGGGMSSRLFMAVRERRGLAYSVHTGTEAYHDAGYMATQCGVEHANLEETIRVILAEYRRIATDLVDAKELNKAKEYIKGGMAMHLESSDEVIEYLVNQEVLRGEIVLPEEQMARIDAVTSEDVLRVAQMIFRPERLNMAILGPHKNAKKFEKLLKL